MSPYAYMAKELNLIQQSKLAAKEEDEERWGGLPRSSRMQIQGASLAGLGALSLRPAGSLAQKITADRFQRAARDLRELPGSEDLYRKVRDEVVGGGVPIEQGALNQPMYMLSDYVTEDMARKMNRNRAVDTMGRPMKRPAPTLSNLSDRVSGGDVYGNVVPGKGLITMPKDAKDFAALAHEAGHADLARNRYGRLLQNKFTAALGMLPVLPAIGGVGVGLSTDNPYALALSSASGGLTSVPMLAYEGLASMKGIKRLKRLGASPEQIRAASKQLRNAWGTYAGQAIKNTGVSTAATGIGRLGRGVTHMGDDLDAAREGA